MLPEQLRSNRFFGHLAGTEFWFGELLGYIFGDMLFLIAMGSKSMGNYWPTVSRMTDQVSLSPSVSLCLSLSLAVSLCLAPRIASLQHRVSLRALRGNVCAVWPQVFHHAVALVSYTVVCLKRCGRRVSCCACSWLRYPLPLPSCSLQLSCSQRIRGC